MQKNDTKQVINCKKYINYILKYESCFCIVRFCLKYYLYECAYSDAIGVR
jgi:hypothetical protein